MKTKRQEAIETVALYVRIWNRKQGAPAEQAADKLTIGELIDENYAKVGFDHSWNYKRFVTDVNKFNQANA